MIEEEIYNHDIVIKRLVLNNFRGFDHLEIDFDDKLTVLIGENGSGKTTILDGIAKFLEFIVGSVSGKGYDPKLLGLVNYDVKNDKEESANSIFLDLNGSEIFINNTITKNSSPVISDTTLEGNEEKIREYSTNIQARLRDGEKINLPIISYYYAMQINTALDKDFKDETILTIFNTYAKSLDPERFNFNSFFNWFDKQQKIKLQRGNKNLEFIVSAITEMLNDEQNTFNGLEIIWGERSNQPDEMITYKNKEKVNVLQLSSGEKSLLSLVGDISRRLILANPYSENPLEGTGIVLIDEIDTHLHPKWQRKVIPKLREIFPNIQFVVTTHSPFVVQNLDKENIRILKNGLILRNQHYVKGRDISSVTFDVFSLEKHPIEQQELLNLMRKCFDLIDEGKIEDAKSILTKLVEVWGEEDGNIIELKTLMELAGDQN